MTCEELCKVLRPSMATTITESISSNSSDSVWTEKRRRRRASPQQRRLKLKPDPERLVVSGIMPTLQALAGFSSDPEVYSRGVCLMPQEENVDAASHLQTTLLEAYCREIGLRIIRLPERVLRQTFGREHRDLSCLLLLGGKDDYFLESPE
ncbi:hypothetical protein TSAR_008710 [Trichomalopsis sarcophagae]|uniref:Ribosomal protein L7Ae/L30e/S12e/Gadd45 domain-containing protein n=1 Tax=Trichomalopsis sarcophagae TaxID=543379 RepID=A0A232F4V9_9HYME|nr:hypothetical protein TSAR_008710 [Trichomalopsis sarcophagae]